MHELSLADGIVRLVQGAAKREHFDSVAVLHLEAGALAGVEVQALRFALNAILPGTCLAGATIRIDETPGRAWCEACAADIQIDSRADPCPRCGGFPVKVTGGSALRVLDLLVRDEERNVPCA
jgi:hydrogenase nickel incorporation protein HypA/HybF